jgi:amino acid transporter
VDTLRRRLPGSASVAVSFCATSMVGGLLTWYGPEVASGGPFLLALAWLVVSVATLLLASAAAEVASAHPAAGGPYRWAFALAPRHRVAWAWFVGWIHLIALVAAVTSIGCYGTAMGAVVLLAVTAGTPTSVEFTFGLFLLIMLAFALLAGHRFAAVLRLGIWWHLLGVAVIGIMLIAVPTPRRTLTEVLGQTHSAAGVDGTAGPVHVLLVGVALALCTLAGFGASAPSNAVWLCVVAAIVLGVPALWSGRAHVAIVSVAPVVLYLAYAAPVLLRRFSRDFQPGRWQVGPASTVIGWTAVAWVPLALFPLTAWGSGESY